MTKEQLLEELQKLPDGATVEFFYREKFSPVFRDNPPLEHHLEFETVKIAQAVIELVKK